MRAIAELIMRGRMQAILVVVGCAALPLLIWLSAAAAALILLRRGAADAFSVWVWALLPAAAWWLLGEPTTLMLVAGTLVLAQVLRVTASWTWVLLASVVLGVVFVQVIEVVSAQMLKGMTEFLRAVFTQYAVEAKVPAEQLADVQASLIAALPGFLASSLQLMCVLCLVLARYWQAALYNPGGFGLEFRAIRLKPAVAVGLLLGVFFTPSLGTSFAVLAPLCTVPLFFAGLALGHGLIEIKRLSTPWVVTLYLAVLILGNLICLLAVIDSLIDFRRRLARNNGAGPANGEG
jgi:hypothetical protein